MANDLIMVVYDVEHGSSAYLQTPNGKHVVIDLGVGSYKRSDATFSPLAHLWNEYGIRRLDAVVITHPHRDHVDDIGNFDSFSPLILHTTRHLTDDEIREGNQSKEGPILEKYIEIRTRYSSPVPDGSSLTPANYGGVEFQFFHPSQCSHGNLNNHSVVVVVSYLGCKILIPGDNESPSWNELLESPSFVQAIRGTDVLVAPHHGREAGYSDALFGYLSPKLTIVSDGPGSETSATTKYSQKSSGWEVFSRSSGNSAVRKCLTTATDQTIVIRIGNNGSGGAYLNVTTA